MKDFIILEKVSKKEKLLEGIADTITLAELAQALSPVDLTRKYMLVMSNANVNAAKNLKLIGIKEYQRRSGQVEIELVLLYD